MFTAIALIVPVVLFVLFCALLKLALPATPRQIGKVTPAHTASTREPVQSLGPVDRRAA
jgi:hypothetical protein